MAVTLTIGGVAKTTYFKTSSLSISDDLNSRNTASFTLVDTAGSYRPSVGQAVVIAEDGTTRFAGTIDDLDEEVLDDETTLFIQVECVDYNQIADRYLVAEVYEDKTLEYIAEDIIDNYLATDSITKTNIETGPTITKAVFNYQNAAQCFDDLADITGYAWNIDYSKDLHFFSRETNIAPYSLTDTSNNFRKMRVKRTRDQYRNKQYVRAGYDITDARTETFKGDGETKTFPTAFPIAKAPSNITISATTGTQTIGIGQIDSGKDWYWNKGQNIITQSTGGTVITSTGTVSLTYQGMYPLLVAAEDPAEIASRATAESGSGVYESIEDESNIDERDLATDKAEGLLRRFGTIPVIVEFETDTAGLEAGQLITINVTAYNLNNTYLIDSVRISDIDGQFLRYQIRALSGESLGSWVDFFKKLAATGRKFVIRENEVLGLLRRFADNIVLHETSTVTERTPLALTVGGYFYDSNGRVAEVLS